MALVVDSQEASGVAQRGTTSPMTWSFTNTAGTFLLLGVEINEDSGTAPVVPSAVTYGGDAMTLVPSSTVSWGNLANTNLVCFYSLASPKTGANTMSITFSEPGVLRDVFGAAISFTGGTGTLGTPVTNHTAFSTPLTPVTVTVTGTLSSSIVVNVAGCGTALTGATSPTVESAINNFSESNAGDNFVLGRQPGGGSVTASYTIGAADLWGISAVEVFAITYDPATMAAMYGVTPMPRFDLIDVVGY